ncbi:hypothetical protein [Legionella sp. CNM-4043-24]|uniref:hypothetical protein n=1 Tax=Legionella sp. CNM-4043-24 TaxID=3421646 RepID=UPI00403B000C
MYKSIVFNNQLIKYRLSLSYNDNHDGVFIHIVFPHAIILKDEKCLDSLRMAILDCHRELIERMIQAVAKDGKANQEVKSDYLGKLSFDSLDLSNTGTTYNFFKGIKMDVDGVMRVPPAFEKHIGSGEPFSVSPKNP